MPNGNIIGKNNSPLLSGAKGVWNLNNIKDYMKNKTWPQLITATGGMIKYYNDYKIHTFFDSGTFSVTDGEGEVEYLVVGAGGGGGMDMGGGGGGGAVLTGTYKVYKGDSITVTVGVGGRGGPAGGTDGQPTAHQFSQGATSGGSSSFGTITAAGGGAGGSSYYGHVLAGTPSVGASGGGASGYSDTNIKYGGQSTPTMGNMGGRGGGQYYSGGGGGAGIVAPGVSSTSTPHGGAGKYSDILGIGYYWGGGGGGAAYSASVGGNGGVGGGGGGAVGTTYGGSGLNPGKPGGGGSPNAQTNRPGGDAGAHTGGGGGGSAHYQQNNRGGQGGSGIVVVKYKTNLALKPTIQNFGTYYAYSDGTYASSALEYKMFDPNCVDGVYRVSIAGVGTYNFYCLMDDKYDGGGWMMAMKATRGTTFNYSSGHWTSATVLNDTTALNRNDGDAKFHSFNYYKGTDLMALWPDIGSGGSIAGLGMWCWLEKNYAGRFQQTTCTPLYIFQNASRTFIKDATQFGGWASGVFSSQTDIRFYGFNWTDNMNCRWGFGWNENGGGGYPFGATGSDDVSGGIGMSYNSYSAGDAISCCQNTTGINRSARVEIYVR